MIPNLSTLEYLLRIYWSPLEHPDAWMLQGGNAEGHRKALNWLRTEGLIDMCSPLCDDEHPSCYHVTARGKVYIEHIRHLPLPVEDKRWVMPKIGSAAGGV